MKKALYPGTFDPVTNGHLDLIERASLLFDRLVVAVADNPSKETLFTREERVSLLKASVKGLKNVEIKHFSGLTVEYARKLKVTAIVRGLRVFSDFEYEFQMALMNRKLVPEVETVFLVPSEQHTYVSSTLIKDIAGFGSDISSFVPPPVVERLRDRFKKEAG
ncbi:MAG: pantetheine-phosphate adenylyltransferase [Candidatus Zixiibacteriota bacterium]|nr:MAG: pantetheine-phosphate adenylyltransferase [candidate division Zixibacteria bacterium]